MDNENPIIASRPLSPQSRKEQLYPEVSPKVTEIEEVILDPYDLDSINIAKQLTPEKRYWFYIEKSIPKEYIAPIQESTIQAIEKHVPTRLIKAESLQKERKKLVAEVFNTYDLALRQSIVDYILMDPNEQTRLGIPLFNIPYVPRILRAPVPWHDSITNTKAFINENLHITNPVMLELLKIYSQVEHFRLFDMSVFNESSLPTNIEQFQATLKSQSQAFKNKLLSE